MEKNKRSKKTRRWGWDLHCWDCSERQTLRCRPTLRWRVQGTSSSVLDRPPIIIIQWRPSVIRLICPVRVRVCVCVDVCAGQRRQVASSGRRQ